MRVARFRQKMESRCFHFPRKYRWRGGRGAGGRMGGPAMFDWPHRETDVAGARKARAMGGVWKSELPGEIQTGAKAWRAYGRCAIRVDGFLSCGSDRYAKWATDQLLGWLKTKNLLTVTRSISARKSRAKLRVRRL
jgi:hypothetical protein